MAGTVMLTRPNTRSRADAEQGPVETIACEITHGGFVTSPAER
jgi:hypothetical protein